MNNEVENVPKQLLLVKFLSRIKEGTLDFFVAMNPRKLQEMGICCQKSHGPFTTYISTVFSFQTWSLFILDQGFQFTSPSS